MVDESFNFVQKIFVYSLQISLHNINEAYVLESFFSRGSLGFFISGFVEVI